MKASRGGLQCRRDDQREHDRPDQRHRDLARVAGRQRRAAARERQQRVRGARTCLDGERDNRSVGGCSGHSVGPFGIVVQFVLVLLSVAGFVA
jgi:hypothetical protein